MKKRNVNIDLIKCIAVFSVVSVHFFLNTNFYDITIKNSFEHYILIFFRTLFMICVPLFMIVTGYLMKNKELNKKYYFGILRVLIFYFISDIIYFVYHHFYLKEVFNIKFMVKSILNYTIGYSWYIEMYIGLFLLIPFFNLIYNNLKTKKQKQILILSMLLLTSFPGLFNFKYILLPDFWIPIYPLTYYFIGCYLNEFPVKMKKTINLLTLFFVLLISSLINFYLSKGNVFVWGVHNDWPSIFNVATSVLVIIFITNFNFDKVNKKLKKIITKISELSLGMYLTSNIVDDYFYNHYYHDVNCSFINYLKIVPVVIIISIFLSSIINIIYKLFNNYIAKIREKV